MSSELLGLAACAILVLPHFSLGATNCPLVLAEKLHSISEPQPSAIVVWSEHRNEPRPIRMHFIRFDLHSRDFAVFAMLSDDPDGDGPAEAALEDPERLFADSGAVAAVNANGFRALPRRDGKVDEVWFAEQPVDIVGLAASAGSIRSRPDAKHSTFWISRDGRAHIGRPASEGEVSDGVSDWSGVLVHKGIELNIRGGNLHPRTLLGMDKSSRWLLLAVIDGRREGYSEGVTLSEGAAIMKEHGCSEAICLDGGGSSIMIVSDAKTASPTIVNRPSGETPRPVPVMLGIRPMAKHSGLETRQPGRK